MWSFFDLIITESRLSIVRFDHSWHLMSTDKVIRSFARLLSHQPWGLWNKMTSPYSKVLRQSRQILTVASSPYVVLCCFDFEIRTPDIKLETENVSRQQWHRWYISVDRTATGVVWRWQFNGHLQEVSFNENHFLRFNEWRVGKYCDV